MRRLRVHPGRFDRARELALLDPSAEAHTIYRTSSLMEFPWETRFGLNLAFYRTFAIPRIAGLLAHTGEMERRPEKRAMDTGLLMYELLEHGFDHPRGREVVRGLNRMHHRWSIDNEDYLYVLATFVVVPTRFIDEFGWRRTTATEREATASFYRELGHRMAIRGMPAGYGDFAAFFDDYERRHVGFSTAGARQMAATQRVIADRLPRVLRPLAVPATSALLDERLQEALGLRPTGSLSRRLVRAALSVRAAIARRQPPRTVSWFEPGRPVSVYPQGYQVSDLGPES